MSEQKALFTVTKVTKDKEGNISFEFDLSDEFVETFKKEQGLKRCQVLHNEAFSLSLQHIKTVDNTFLKEAKSWLEISLSLDLKRNYKGELESLLKLKYYLAIGSLEDT